ncbi:hypothetical protein [Corynebacterium sp. 335C]
MTAGGDSRSAGHAHEGRAGHPGTGRGPTPRQLVAGAAAAGVIGIGLVVLGYRLEDIGFLFVPAGFLLLVLLVPALLLTARTISVNEMRMRGRAAGEGRAGVVVTGSRPGTGHGSGSAVGAAVAPVTGAGSAPDPVPASGAGSVFGARGSSRRARTAGCGSTAVLLITILVLGAIGGLGPALLAGMLAIFVVPVVVVGTIATGLRRWARESHGIDR